MSSFYHTGLCHAAQRFAVLNIFYSLFQLLSLYSQVLRDLFASAQKGVVEELPVVKLEDESATDIRTLLDLLYPDNYQVVNGMYSGVDSQDRVRKQHKSISVA